MTFAEFVAALFDVVVNLAVAAVLLAVSAFVVLGVIGLLAIGWRAL